MLSGGSLAPRTKRMDSASTLASSPRSDSQAQQGLGQETRSCRGKTRGVQRWCLPPTACDREPKQARGVMCGRRVVRSPGFEVRPGSDFWLHYLLAVRYLVRLLVSLSLSVLLHKMGRVTSLPHGERNKSKDLTHVKHSAQCPAPDAPDGGGRPSTCKT